MGWRSAADSTGLGLGAWIIVLIAIASSTLLALRPSSSTAGMQMWLRTRNHYQLYEPVADEWNRVRTNSQPVQLHLLSDQALERRMLAGFLGSTHTADVIELERNLAGTCFAGPLDEVGFVDLTDRLQQEGIYNRINQPSFGPWTSRGRVFGLPHDVHPVLLAYRADLVEAAGIDVERIQTWDDFEREMRPLVQDLDGDGSPDRYPLNFWHTSYDLTEVLILQAGGQYFDTDGRPVVDSEVNAEALVRMVRWVTGPDRIAADAPEFTAAGNRLRIEGVVVCSFAPDWLVGVWRQDLPQLAGKVKLMPLPAWRPGGRRASVWGGSMLGIARTTPHFEDAWAFAKELYLAEDVARRLYETTGIISPVKDLWDKPFYDEPVAYFSGQRIGRLYVTHAPEVPCRTSSPFNMFAKQCVRDALVGLRHFAEEKQCFEPAALLTEARRQLSMAQDQVERQLQRNVFLAEGQN